MTIVDKLNELGQDLEIGYKDNFGEALDQRKSDGAVDDVLWPIHKKLPLDKLKYLYHYTSQRAAFSILEARTLRATDAHFLNDVSEIKHGADALKKALVKLEIANPSKHGLIEPAVSFLTDPFSEDKKDAYKIHRGNAYVVSLSTEGDDVSQWQKYAVRHGVSLGFRVDPLSKAVLVDCNGQKSDENETPHIEALLAPVMYDSVDALADLLFEDMCSLELGNTFYSQKLHAKLVERYACFSSLMKHPSFSSESEWRLLLTQAQVNREEACWQPGEAYAKPYATLRFGEADKSSETNSLCGRCNVMINARDYSLARHYFDSIGVDVLESNAPLRPQ